MKAHGESSVEHLCPAEKGWVDPQVRGTTIGCVGESRHRSVPAGAGRLSGARRSGSGDREEWHFEMQHTLQNEMNRFQKMKSIAK
jgi:hypothetical protein